MDDIINESVHAGTDLIIQVIPPRCLVPPAPLLALADPSLHGERHREQTPNASIRTPIMISALKERRGPSDQQAEGDVDTAAQCAAARRG